jgi:hypothetical protein
MDQKHRANWGIDLSEIPSHNEIYTSSMGPLLQISNTESRPPAADARASSVSLAGPPLAQDTAVIDEWLKLEAELTPLAQKIRRRDELRTQILTWFPNLAPDKGETVTGTAADIWISECDKQRKITDSGKRSLHKLWGLRLFRSNARFTLSQLPDPKDAAGLFTVQERTGPRHLKVLPRMGKAA